MDITWVQIGGVALGGAAGAVLRYLAGGWVQTASASHLPWGTLTVNVLGSFLLGLLFQATTDRFLISPAWRLLLTTGFCGGLTTFSTFSYETLRLMEAQQWSAAAGNVALNLVLTISAAFAGVVLARIA